MPEIVLRLHKYADEEAAGKVADAIKAIGEIRYTDATGADVTVSVGDVTIDNSTNA